MFISPHVSLGVNLKDSDILTSLEQTMTDRYSMLSVEEHYFFHAGQNLFKIKPDHVTYQNNEGKTEERDNVCVLSVDRTPKMYTLETIMQALADVDQEHREKIKQKLEHPASPQKQCKDCTYWKNLAFEDPCYTCLKTRERVCFEPK